MKSYGVFDLDGVCVGAGTCSDDDIRSVGWADTIVIEGDYLIGKFYVVDGVAHQFTDEQQAAYNARPLFATSWGLNTMSWVVVETTDVVNAARVMKWEEIKQKRADVEFSPFTWDGSSFDADIQSRTRVQGAVMMAQLAVAQGQGAGFSVDWTLSDNTIRTLGAADMIAAGLALGNHVGAAYATARSLRAGLAAASTLAEVAAIVWPS